jgi:hypothetical protein
MSKRGKTRLITEIIMAGDPVYRDDSIVIFALPGAPNLYIFTKEVRPQWLGFTTEQGIDYKCQRCNAHHMLFWEESDYDAHPEMPRHADSRLIAVWERLRQHPNL